VVRTVLCAVSAWTETTPEPHRDCADHTSATFNAIIDGLKIAAAQFVVRTVLCAASAWRENTPEPHRDCADHTSATFNAIIDGLK
jgi:hypothetical protein